MAENISFDRIPADVRDRWNVVLDVCAGDQALRAGEYLPTLNAEDKSAGNLARNKAYRQRAVLFTATSFTRDGLIGLAYRNDPRAELPPKLEYLLKDADGAGTSIYQQSQAALAKNLEIGRHGLYVDFSQALARPVIKAYLATDIINWRYSLSGGKSVLSLVVLREEIEVEDGGYGLLKTTQYRELALENGICVCRIWRESGEEGKPPVVIPVLDANGEEVSELALRSSGAVLDFIPFQFIGSQNNDASIDPSPLYGLAKVNIAHFRNSADFEDSVFFVGQAQPYIAGLSEEWRDHIENPRDENGRPTGAKMYIGSRAPILLPSGGTFGFAQALPNMLVKDAMDQKEKQMIALGARMIDRTTAAKTATGENNDREATTSVLAMCVSNVSEAYQNCIAWCARYLDIEVDSAASFKINQDFVGMSADPSLITALVSAWQSGLLAKADVRAFFRRQSTIATERTDAEIDADIENEGPALGTLAEPPVTPAANA